MGLPCHTTGATGEGRRLPDCGRRVFGVSYNWLCGSGSLVLTLAPVIEEIKAAGVQPLRGICECLKHNPLGTTSGSRHGCPLAMGFKVCETNSPSSITFVTAGG